MKTHQNFYDFNLCPIVHASRLAKSTQNSIFNKQINLPSTSSGPQVLCNSYVSTAKLLNHGNIIHQDRGATKSFSFHHKYENFFC